MLVHSSPVNSSETQDYLIVYSNDTSPATRSLPKRGTFQDSRLQGCSRSGSLKFRTASLDAQGAANLRQQQGVKSVSLNNIGSLSDFITQTGLGYNLPRISSRNPGSSDYRYDSLAGKDTCVFVIDSGYAAHPDFEGRNFAGPSFLDSPDHPGVNVDDVGHGTHVAGIVGSKTYGVAKKAKIISVKACAKREHKEGEEQKTGCTIGAIMYAIDWIVHFGREVHGCQGASVVNMSVIGDKNEALDECVNEATRQENMFFVVAAGNNGTEARNFSPMAAMEACVVGAIGEGDQLANFNNFGKEVRLFAPGLGILSTWTDGGEGGFGTVSRRLAPSTYRKAGVANPVQKVLGGTSMAAPHVAGVAAMLFTRYPSIKSTKMCERLRLMASRKEEPPSFILSNSILYNGEDKKVDWAATVDLK